MMSTYKPQQFAKMIGVSVKTLQRWDNEGVLTANRTPTSRRYYTHSQYLEYTGVKEKISINNLRDIYEIGDISPRLSNSVIDNIMNSDEIIGMPHKIFAYCYLGVISYLTINNKLEKYKINVSDIKRFLGYSEINKKLDYIIKRGGSLEYLGLIREQLNPNEDIKNTTKVPLVLDEMNDCHTFNLKLFFESLENEKIWLTGFFIANYIKEFNPDFTYGVRGSISYICKTLNISDKTVRNYVKELSDNNMIKKSNTKGRNNISDINIFLRGKLKDWTNNSLNIHDNKCFITGETDNIVVHHIIPYNSIRDFLINFIDIEDKPIAELDDEKISLMEKMFLDYHKLLVGIPLTESVHTEFHKQYGNYATFEDLLEFKYNNI